MAAWFLIASLFILGLVSTTAAIGGWYGGWLVWLLLLPIGSLANIFRQAIPHFTQLNRGQRWLWSLLAMIWCSHLIQVWLPETGFDAVWYHLPVIKSISQAGQLVYLPDLYQSLNPLFSDLIFGLGWLAAADLGTKLVAYLFGICLVVVCFSLARLVLNQTWSLVFIILVSLIQVVAWQSASFYIDLAKSFWEVSALLLVLSNRRAYQIGLVFGASLATKLFSILLWPVMAAIVYWQAGSWRQTLRFILFSLVVVLPFYYFAHFYTGNPFYSLAVHLDKLSQISGQSELAGFLMARSLTIPFSLVQLVVARDYISPVLISLVVPILWLGRRVIRLSQQLQILLFFAASQWVIWWLVPPLSTRYALSGFIVLILLLLKILQHLYDSQSQWRPVIQLVLAMSVLLTILPRLYVNYRGLRFLISGQPKAVYLEQFYDGWSDPKLQEWHQQPAGPT